MRIAVISPFLDRSHGTERCVIEQLERLPVDAGAEIHLYAQRVQDLRGVRPYKPHTYQREMEGSQQAPIFWHKVPSIRGPHLLQYIFWFLANRAIRWWDAHFRDLKCDLLFSPGINSTDADCIAIHIVFHEFHDRVLPHLRYRQFPLLSWPLVLHRRLYYRLIMSLETKVYGNKKVALTGVSGLVAGQVEKYFQRKNVRVIRYGVDAENFSPQSRLARRAAVREQLGLLPEDFTLLLIGNDWKKKGLDALLVALKSLSLPSKLLVVGSDNRQPYQAIIQSLGIADRVIFLDSSPDVSQFYAAADAYVGPSLEDAYGLPILEAMACGLPAVASSRAGACEIIQDRINGLILQDPENAQELGRLLEMLFANPQLCRQMGERAHLTAVQHTWDRNAREFWEWLGVGSPQK